MSKCLRHSSYFPIQRWTSVAPDHILPRPPRRQRPGASAAVQGRGGGGPGSQKNQGKDGRHPFWPWFSLVFLVNRDGKDGRNWKNGDDHPNHIPFWGQGLLVLMGITELVECSKFGWIHLRIEDPNPAYSRKSQGQDVTTQIPIWCV